MNDKTKCDGKKLRVAIAQSDFRQKTVAFRANTMLLEEAQISEIDISKFCNSRKSPTPQQAAAIAAVFGRTTEELFG